MVVFFKGSPDDFSVLESLHYLSCNWSRPVSEFSILTLTIFPHLFFEFTGQHSFVLVQLKENQFGKFESKLIMPVEIGQKMLYPWVEDCEKLGGKCVRIC